MKADLRSAVARQVWARRVGCDEPSAEVEVADAGRAGASADAFEISHPAIWSTRPSRDAARIRPSLHSPARLRLSRCLIRLGEHPPPADLSTGAAACWGRARHDTVKPSPVGSIGTLVMLIWLIVACRAAFVKSFSKNFCTELVKLMRGAVS